MNWLDPNSSFPGPRGRENIGKKKPDVDSIKQRFEDISDADALSIARTIDISRHAKDFTEAMKVNDIDTARAAKLELEDAVRELDMKDDDDLDIVTKLFVSMSIASEIITAIGKSGGVDFRDILGGN